MPTNGLFSPIWLTVLIVAGVLALAALWRLFGPGPRRARKLRQAQRLLQQGKWGTALEFLRKARGSGDWPRRWRKRFNAAEADCLEAARGQALSDKNYDEALEHALALAELRGQPDDAARADIQSAMLDEVRRLFAEGNARKVNEFAARPLLAASAEASFWQGLCLLRDGQPDKALTFLQASVEGRGGVGVNGSARSGEALAVVSTSFLDPLLYVGALLLKRGQAKEALRLLTEANRLDGSCSLVTVQLGSAMIAAAGDAGFAVRALKKALGSKGLGQWAGKPAQAWVEAFPEARSYIRKLAAKYPYHCPLWGSDLQPMVRQGNLALAQGLYRLGQYQEASEFFTKVLQEGAPSAALLRGLGMSLARIGKYDDAFKHLRIAHEMEDPKDRLTAGYLALCGARGKPSRSEDKVQNAAWAVQLVARFNAPGDAEWVGIIGEVFAEARACQVPLSEDQQIYLCEHLWSVLATDERAIQAYLHLQQTYPRSVRPEYASLFCRGVQQFRAAQEKVGVNSNQAASNSEPRGAYLDLFALTFAHEADARGFFGEKQWDFDEVELTYLALAAEIAPGSFPANLGPDYPVRGKQLMLARAKGQEEAGQVADAVKTMDLLTRLAPQDSQALDQLAYLHHRQGQDDLALSFLARWHECHPRDPLPLMRQAVLLYRKHQSGNGQERIRQALSLAEGRQRAHLAYWSARLVLRQGREEATLLVAQDLLRQCVHDNPEHLEALECLAAVRWQLKDASGLAAQAKNMERADVQDARFHFFAALCHWAGQDPHATLRETAGSDKGRDDGVLGALLVSTNGDRSKPAELNLAVESAYLAGLAHRSLNDWAEAHQALEAVARSNSPSTPSAQALLGAVCIAEEKYEGALEWWQKLDAKKRAEWLLAEPLANTMFLAAIQAMEAGRFEEGAEKLRAAGKLGCRDRRLGPLLILALFRAGQSAYYQQ